MWGGVGSGGLRTNLPRLVRLSSCRISENNARQMDEQAASCTRPQRGFSWVCAVCKGIAHVSSYWTSSILILGTSHAELHIQLYSALKLEELFRFIFTSF